MKLMTIPEQIGAIIQVAATLHDDGHQLEWYVFGSSLVNLSTANDLDILVLYTNSESPATIKESLSSANIPAIIDLLLLEKHEEAELEFLEHQQHRQFFPV